MNVDFIMALTSNWIWLLIIRRMPQFVKWQEDNILSAHNDNSGGII